MSWDSYIDNLIGQSKDAYGTPQVDKACIIGLDGSRWTTANHPNALVLSDAEANTIGMAFKNKDFTTFMTNGILIASIKYIFLRVEDDKIVYGKKKGQGAVTLQASHTAVVIGHVPEGAVHGNANKAVGSIAEYLESLNMRKKSLADRVLNILAEDLAEEMVEKRAEDEARKRAEIEQKRKSSVDLVDRLLDLLVQKKETKTKRSVV